MKLISVAIPVRKYTLDVDFSRFQTRMKSLAGQCCVDRVLIICKTDEEAAIRKMLNGFTKIEFNSFL